MAYDQIPEYSDESVGSWMLTLFVCGIPIIGVIYLLVLAFGSGATPSKRNFARAALIWTLIALAVTVVFRSCS
ncbi:hypothetical protein [Schaalia odontolytica]|uniref:hypothetical protein n=1 Tax=Schaalia odontolytica TaxID=1660 RepID=UPI00210F1C49|nr:hypothetical protein [Schaalia odontolytica]MCQ5271474.1 hypothetical protein [Schaalia odontolytica]MCQ5281260.1 hypothetical protein [Schaalia odontolytica]